MRTLIILLFFLSCFSLLTSCQGQKRQKKIIHIFCDQFPELKIDSITTDTTGLKKYIQGELAENKNDSISFIIECPNNIVLPNVIQTENILKKQISLFEIKDTNKITIYNKCLSEFSWPPWGKEKRRPVDLTVKADINGKLSIDNKSITLDSICEKYRGQNITIEINADKKLSRDKFIEILDRLYKADFKVLIATKDL